ncbi:MAG: heavy-metal-associated domain-containing protein [Phycisphaerales bacterium]
MIRSSISSLLFVPALLTGVALTGCASSGSANTASASIDSNQSSQTSGALVQTGSEPIEASSAVMQVTGMSCPKCANNITLQLKQVKGVEEVLINMGIGQVIVSFDAETHPTRDQLASAIQRAGFTLQSITAR